MRTLPIAKLGLIIAGVWVASIPCAEAVFRLGGERTTTDMVGAFQAFGTGGYRLRENFYGDTDTLQGRFAIATNRLGLRCAPGAGQRMSPERPIDILVMGDSQAFGAGLNFEDSLVGQLAARAAARGLRLENAAVGGHFLDNQFELLLWLDAHNERPKSIVLLLSPYLVTTAGTYNKGRVEADGRLYEMVQGRRTLTSWLKRHTVLYARVRNTFNAMFPIPGDNLVPLAVRTFLTSNGPDYQQRLNRRIGDWHAWCAHRDISLSIVYTPWALEMAFEPVLHAAASVGKVDRNVPFEASRQAAESLNLPFYDLRPALHGRVAANQPISLPGDEHYNAATSAACAGLLWDLLTSNPRRPPLLTANSSASVSPAP